MIAILIESYGGKWPYWLSPWQAMKNMVEIDTDPSDTLNKKIRNAQLAQFNFILGTYQAFNK